MQTYETSRLILRGLTVKESDLLLDYLLRNKNFLQEWEPLRDDSYYSLTSVKRMIENENASFKNKSSLYVLLNEEAE